MVEGILNDVYTSTFNSDTQRKDSVDKMYLMCVRMSAFAYIACVVGAGYYFNQMFFMPCVFKDYRMQLQNFQKHC